jgi:hypothetical protein
MNAKTKIHPLKPYIMNTMQDADEVCEIIDNPREYDNLGSMVCYHRRYNLGDKQEYLPGHYKPNSGDFWGWGEMRSYFDKVHDLAVCLPVYMYEHSGIAVSTKPFSCPWDSGRIGFIFVSKDKLRKEYGVKRVTASLVDKATRILEAEVEEYNQYLNQ